MQAGPRLPKHALQLAFLALALIALLSSRAFAKTLSEQEALALIDDTADRICSTVTTRGEATSNEVKGEIKAQLSGLAAKFADASGSVSGGHSNESYIGVVRTDLAATIRNITACRLRVFDTLQAKFLPNLPTFHTRGRPVDQHNDTPDDQSSSIDRQQDDTPETKTFNHPIVKVNGRESIHVDWCLAENNVGIGYACGEPVAEKFCQKSGYSKADGFRSGLATYDMNTYHFGDGTQAYGTANDGSPPRRYLAFVRCSN